MPSVSKSRSKWRVRIRLHGLPSVSKVFKTKQTARTWGHKTEQAMMIGALLPDQDCSLCELLERDMEEKSHPPRGVAVKKYFVSTRYVGIR